MGTSFVTLTAIMLKFRGGYSTITDPNIAKFTRGIIAFGSIGVVLYGLNIGQNRALKERWREVVQTEQIENYGFRPRGRGMHSMRRRGQSSLREEILRENEEKLRSSGFFKDGDFPGERFNNSADDDEWR